jgi:hypothetical protein
MNVIFLYVHGSGFRNGLCMQHRDFITVFKACAAVLSL